MKTSTRLFCALLAIGLGAGMAVNTLPAGEAQPLQGAGSKGPTSTTGSTGTDQPMTHALTCKHVRAAQALKNLEELLIVGGPKTGLLQASVDKRTNTLFLSGPPALWTC